MKQNEIALSDAVDVIEEVLATGGTFRMMPKGTSMLPLIVQGRDSVVLTRCQEPAAKKNDIVFYRRANGQFVLHRVVRVEKDGTFRMRGDNQLLEEKGIEASQIIGVVSALYQGEKVLDLRSFRYRFYVFLRSFYPIRWVLLRLEQRKRQRLEQKKK